jgi:VanZ family protein
MANGPALPRHQGDVHRARARRLFDAGLIAQTAFVLLTSLGAYLGSLPTQLPSWPHADLAGHAVLVGMVAFFLAGALALRGRAGWIAPVAVLACAGIEEWAQRFSPLRSSSWVDFAADVIGVCVLSWLARACTRPRRSSRRGTPPDPR